MSGAVQSVDARRLLAFSNNNSHARYTVPVRSRAGNEPDANPLTVDRTAIIAGYGQAYMLLQILLLFVTQPTDHPPSHLKAGWGE